MFYFVIELFAPAMFYYRDILLQGYSVAGILCQERDVPSVYPTILSPGRMRKP